MVKAYYPFGSEGDRYAAKYFIFFKILIELENI